jgi:hypothetical protein
VTAAAINNRGDIAGFDTDAQGNVDSFLLSRWGHETTLDFPGATSTQALGVNDAGALVGFYADGAGNTDGMLAMPLSHHRHH